MQTYISQAAAFLRTHQSLIAVGVVSVLLVLYGAYINSFFKRMTRKWPFFLRYCLFLVLCTAGYATLANLSILHLSRLLRGLPDTTLVVSFAILFLGLAWLARTGKEI